jgi:hypothetical protein
MKYKHILEIHAKEWFDRVNGNSYFSAIGYLNDELVLELPFQYGYGDHYQDIAYDKLKSLPVFSVAGGALWSLCDNNQIKLITSKQENCKKREL